ncbi:hypothetical protein DPMN_174835 [Dreissena polymorpha]|uniref:Mannosyltransferase n=1 Tax=Dreissena polymorpha TaxID=45954 RepID=A0A9D4E640_DREPO|nr:hypothetical protein DPMN_174835 [Dreissena polymorpha]
MSFLLQGALLKAAFLCAEIVDLDSSTTLRDQLLTNYGGGFELHSWTHLPHGSGMYPGSIWVCLLFMYPDEQQILTSLVLIVSFSDCLLYVIHG